MTRPQTAIRAAWAVVLACTLLGCTSSSTPSETTAVPSFASAQIKPPPGVDPDTCWVRDVAPAQIETVTRQIEVAPASIGADGTVIAPARYQTETVQVIATERQKLIFETPCPDAITPEFIATLQRALEARGLYRGPVTGVMDVATLRAVRRYQSGQGLPSGLLSMQAARGLGLLATPLDEL